VSRPNDSISYYWTEAENGGPYKYGELLIGGAPMTNMDLCLRLCGKARVGNEFAVQSNVAWRHDPDQPWWDTMPYTGPGAWDACIRRESEVGAKYDKIGYGFWGLVQRTGNTRWVWGWLDTLMTSFANHGVRPIMAFRGTPAWATCGYSRYGAPSGGAIPVGLYEGVKSGDSINPNNYYAKYVYEFVRRYGPLGYAFNSSPSGTFWREHTELPLYVPILHFEGFAEVPDGGLGKHWDTEHYSRGYWRLFTDYWHQESLVDPVYRDTLISHIQSHGGDTLAGRKSSLASVYARLVIVVDSALKMACSSPASDTSRPQSMAYVSDDGWYGMHDWLTRLKSYGADEFFDVASLWGYAGVDYPSDHVANLQRVRSDLDNAGYAPRPCVFTEFGTSWPDDWSQVKRAYHVTGAYSLTQFANAIPPGTPALAGAWFTFCKQYMQDDHWPIIDDSAHDWESWEPAYAYQQWSALTNKADFEGQIPVSDSFYLLQFEDSVKQKLWVGWTERHIGQVMASVPARSDTIDSMSTQCGENPNIGAKICGASGWLGMPLETIPLIVRERSNISRPELVAESLWLSPIWSGLWWIDTVHVKIRNRDSERSTPEGCATWVRITWNDSIVGSICRTDTIGAGQTVVESFAWELPEWFHGDGLLAANVNPGMSYVEKEGTDDNQTYLRTIIRGAIGGTLDVVAPASGKTNAPLLPMRLTSISWEDSTGQTPADSARVLFAWYGQRDSVVHATDTTAWFPFCADTVLQFPRGCAVYRVYAQYRDSGGNNSPFYGDSTDSIVVFDTLPPGGSIIIEDGGRFVSNSACTLRLAASDSSSGVAMMRFINSSGQSPYGYSPFGLVQNGGFDPAGGYWSFTSGGYDSTLQMGRLSVAPSQESKVTQYVPAESIAAYAGDSCVLQASILAHVHDDGSAGSASFWYYSTRVDSENLHDSLFVLVDSAGFSGDLLSLTGLSSLSKRFLLSPPSSDSVWIWKGGVVKVEASAEDGSGSVWTDNVKLTPFPPESGYVWWGPFETLKVWDVGSGAGEHTVSLCLMDSAGAENAVPYADTVILDPVAPVVDISLPHEGLIVDGLVEITGYAYDPVEGSGGEFFESRRLFYRNVDSTNWLPVDPDSVSYQEAPPDSMSSQGPAVHLGYWNTLLLENAPYYLTLTAADSAGNVSSCTTWVMVDHGFGRGGFCSGPEGGGTGLGEGSCYVGSATGTVLHLSDDLTVLDTFAVADSGSEACVTAILEVESDSILVLDAHNKRVHKLHKDGQHRRRLVSNLSEPVDLKRDENGNLWLADRGTSKIGKFRPDGSLVFTRGGLGKDSLHFDSPEGIAVKGNLVYVADTKNDRIVLLDTCGKYRAVIKGKFEKPTAVWVQSPFGDSPQGSGAIYLTDGSDGKLKGITPLGGNIVTIGTSDSSKLKGLVPSENRHNLFSIAAGPNKVYKLRIQSDDSLPEGVQSGGKVNLPRKLSLSQPFPNPARTRLSIAYALPRQTQVALKLYDVAGKLVKALVNGVEKPGYYNLVWNRQDAKGRTCACGVYFCTLAAENQRFSRKVILTE